MQHELRTVAIDLAKKVFHLVGTDTTSKILWRKRLTRHALAVYLHPAVKSPRLIRRLSKGQKGLDGTALMAS